MNPKSVLPHSTILWTFLLLLKRYAKTPIALQTMINICTVMIFYEDLFVDTGGFRALLVPTDTR